MRCLIAIIAVMLWVNPVGATIDPDPDQLGVYFDLNADENCLTIGPSVPFFAYVIITNPSAGQVQGLEFGYRLDIPAGHEGLLFRLQATLPPGGIDFEYHDLIESDYVVGLAAPIPAENGNVIFLTWQFMLLTTFTIDFHLGPAVIQSLPDGLPAYETGGSILPLGVASGDVNLPVASVNGDCNVVRTETVSFGRVKSLYR